MKEKKRPARAANQISSMLNEVLGPDRFPVDVVQLAQEYSKVTSADPIVQVVGEAFDDFDGMLKASSDQSKWMIIYNTNCTEGRQRFTIAHEFGHYILHRKDQRLFECSSSRASEKGSVDRNLEKEADEFAVALLMPLDDFRRQIKSKEPGFELFSHLAERYGVSLTAAALRWINVAPKRAVLVASRDGFMLWASSNQAAYNSGAVFATRKNTIELPESALAVREDCPAYGAKQKVPAHYWFENEHPELELIETMVATEQYDYTLTLLLLPDIDGGYDDDREDELLEDIASQFI
jgi:Zn-dependent peptidase ImmA (M78 family)